MEHGLYISGTLLNECDKHPYSVGVLLRNVSNVKDNVYFGRSDKSGSFLWFHVTNEMQIQTLQNWFYIFEIDFYFHCHANSFRYFML